MPATGATSLPARAWPKNGSRYRPPLRRRAARDATWCMGLTHHRTPWRLSSRCSILALLRGKIGRAGAGVAPVRGDSNVQGDRTMGVTSTGLEACWTTSKRTFPGLAVCRDKGRDAAAYSKACSTARCRAPVTGRQLRRGRAGRAARAGGARSLQLHPAHRHQANRTHCHPGEVGLLLPTLVAPTRTCAPAAEQVHFHRRLDEQRACLAWRETADHRDAAWRAGHGRPACRGARLRAVGALGALTDDYAVLRERIEHCQRGVKVGFQDYNARLVARTGASYCRTSRRSDQKHRQRQGAVQGASAARR